MARKAVITVLCANCGKFLGTKLSSGPAGVSHGLCPECDAIEEEKLVDQIAESRGISREEARKLVEKWNAENPLGG